MNLIFLMGNTIIGKDSYPLYLTEITPITLLEKQIKFAQRLDPSNMIFCILKSDIESFSVDSIIKCLEPKAKIVVLEQSTKGALCTALLASSYVDNDEELLIMAIDDFVDENYKTILAQFREKNADAGVVSFTSVHPRYSFMLLDESERPIEFVEKRPVSKNALASFYYYKHGKEFIDCAKNVIRKDNAIKSSFFISQTMNEMILKQKNINIYKIGNEHFFPLKTQLQIAEYLSEYKDRKNSK